MKKIIKPILILIMIFAFTVSVNGMELDSKTDVPIDKVWTITFNMKVDEGTVNTDNIYIEDSEGNILESYVNMNSEEDGDSVYLIPKTNYKQGQTYRICITDGVKSITGESLDEAVEMEFTTLSVNNPPEIANPVEDMVVEVGEVVAIDLNTVFEDADNDSLIFAATVGNIYGSIFRYTVTENKDIVKALIGASDGEDVITYEFNIITNKAISFGDSTIEATVREAADKASGTLYVEDVINITELTLNNEEISDLEGIQYLIGLRELKLAFNNISDISMLGNLVNLETLDLRVNDIEDIDSLSELVNLTTLQLSHNNISDVSPLKYLTNLVDLDLSYNNIKDVTPLYNIADNLEILLIDENPIEVY